MRNGYWFSLLNLGQVQIFPIQSLFLFYIHNKLYRKTEAGGYSEICLEAGLGDLWRVNTFDKTGSSQLLHMRMKHICMLWWYIATLSLSDSYFFVFFGGGGTAPPPLNSPVHCRMYIHIKHFLRWFFLRQPNQ